MSEELAAQLETVDRIRDLDLSRDELERLAALTEKLHTCTLFRRLSLPELAYIAHAGTVLTLERGELLIQQGNKDRVLYVVLEGQLRVWETNQEGKRQLLGYHYPGDHTGEMIMLRGDERIANVDVVEEATVVAFEQEGWERISEHGSLLNYLRREGPDRVQEDSYPFEGKQLDEVILYRARKSWVALLRQILAPLTSTGILWAVVGLLSSRSLLPVEIATSIGLAVSVFMFLWVIWIWQDWRNDDYILTSKRVIHIERVLIPPFPIERHEAAIQMIQELRTTNQGIWTLIFGIKTVVVRTMGSGLIRFPDLENADEFGERIFNAQQKEISRNTVPEPTQIRRRIATELGYDVKQVISLDSEAEEENDGPPRTRTGILNYLIPYTRVEESDRVTWRQHWLILLSKIVVPLLVFFVSLVLIFLVWTLRMPGLDESARRGWWLLPGLVLMLISIGWYLWRYDEWRNDVYQVTDSRIIDIEGSPFHLRKEVRTEGTFDVIQNITYDSPNLFYRLLDIGFVTIDTAAEESAYTFDWVSHPAEVQQEIFRRWTAYREEQQEAETAQRHQEFLEWIVEYDRLVRREGEQHARSTEFSV